MALSRQEIEDVVFGMRRGRRFTQDSPVLPDVWVAYNPFREKEASANEAPVPQGTGATVDLLLTPNRTSNPGELCEWMIKRLRAERQTQYWREKWSNKPPSTQLSYNESTVAAKLRFDELVRVALPLTRWWCEYVWNERNPIKFSDFDDLAKRQKLADQMEAGADDESVSDLLWMIEIIGRIQWEYEREELRHPEDKPKCLGMVDAFHRLTEGMDLKQLPEASVLWSVNRNRPVAQAVWKSVVATKADAAIRLFGLSCEGLQWAIVDSGIDATHPAFRKRVPREQPITKESRPFNKGDGSAENQTRVAMTYDFTRLRQIMSLEVHADGTVKTPALRPKGAEKGNEGSEPSAGRTMPATSPAHPVPPRPGTADAGGEPVLASFSLDDLDRIRQMQDGLRSGRTLDWRTLQLLLRIPHESDEYARPIHEHGTHVAGILAGDWRLSDDPSVPGDHDLRGVCPDLTLLDLRVLDAEGRGDEFAVLAALQFIRWLNANKDTPVVHEVNISMSLLHDVANFACGRTPVCDECERLVGSGVVVVAAAGNEGYAQFSTPHGPKDGYRSISITDPGNAEGVITVGATHRFMPHTYGVAYFSSRGPTGDGRPKPDLVAPGEKIKSVIPKPGKDHPWSAKAMDGTSMAAPHVSGAAALLMARHGELIGQPARIKQILCKSATDLGRERFFQGAGMVDVLRALQSV